MNFDWLQLLYFIPEVLCVLACVLHSVFQRRKLSSLSEKIELLCVKCGAIVPNGEVHECPTVELTEDQVRALASFVASMEVRK